MSILKSIKGTFKTVQDDFSEGLKSITEKQPQVPERHHHSHQTSVNFDAGGEILHRYEDVWKELYTYTEETAKHAQGVDVDIAKLLVRYEHQSEILSRLHQEAANLPMLLTQLQDITNSLAQVEEDYDKVEVGLVHLENLCEEIDYQREKRSHHNQLAVYKMKKEHEIQRHKVQLAREHAHNVQLLEKKREQLLKERQSAYEEQFSSDVDFYKKHGKLERIPGTPEANKKLDIADVQIEDDPAALNEFLASSATDSAETSEKAEPSDEEGPVSKVIPEVTSEITSPDCTESSGITSPSSIESSEMAAPEDASSVQSSSLNDSNKDITSPVEHTEENVNDATADKVNDGADDSNKDNTGSVEQTAEEVIETANKETVQDERNPEDEESTDEVQDTKGEK